METIIEACGLGKRYLHKDAVHDLNLSLLLDMAFRSSLPVPYELSLDSTSSPAAMAAPCACRLK